METAIRLDPSDQSATYQLMIVYHRMGRERDAAELQTRVRQFLDTKRTEETESNRYRLVRAPDERPAQ